MKKDKGISLIVLIITIIVIIILAGAVILTLANNNPINKANESVFKNDLDTFRTELIIYHASKFSNSGGKYNQSELQAGQDTITDIIKSLENNKKYEGKLYIENGELVYICTGTIEDDWAEQIGIIVKCVEPQVSISTPIPQVVNSNNDVVYTINASSNYLIKNVVEENIKVYRVKTSSEASDIEINGVLHFNYKEEKNENGKYIKPIEVTVDTNGFVDGNYYIKVLPDTVVTEINGKEAKNKVEVTSSDFEVNNTVPVAPTIVADITGPTRGNVSVTITFNGGDQNIRRYKIGGSEWVETSQKEISLTITENILIIATEINSLGTPNSTNYEVANIDRVPPVIAIIGSTEISIEQNSTYLDEGATATDDSSGISGSISVINNVNTGVIDTYNVVYSVSDRAGNTASATRIVHVTIPAAPTSWTFLETIKTSITWIVPETGWYKIHVIGKGGSGGDAGDGSSTGNNNGGGGGRRR